MNTPSLENEEWRENFNVWISGVTEGFFVTPYNPFNRIRRLMDQNNINITNEIPRLDGLAGEVILPVAQYKDPKEDPKYFLYFSFSTTEMGYEVYAEVATQEELNDIMSLGDDEEIE